MSGHLLPAYTVQTLSREAREPDCKQLQVHESESPSGRLKADDGNSSRVKCGDDLLPL